MKLEQTCAAETSLGKVATFLQDKFDSQVGGGAWAVVPKGVGDLTMDD